MTIEEYRQFVIEGASPAYDSKLALLGLVGEVGELADVVKKENIYSDMSKFVDKYGMSVKDKIIDEAGDVFWQYTLVLAKYGVTLEEVMEKNFAKLTKRHGGVKTSADGGGER